MDVTERRDLDRGLSPLFRALRGVARARIRRVDDAPQHASSLLA